ncbi:MAG: mechanosensitive ion channel family protein [Anaerovoracaceae bacterium]|jgi:small conductance mechanosensitive channel
MLDFFAAHRDTMIDIATTAAIFLIGLLVIKIVLTVLRKALKKSVLDEVLHRFIVNAVKLLLFIVLLLMVLNRLHIQTASLITVLGVGGAAIALALKDSLGNIAGGIVVMVTKPFTSGDYVDIEGTTGYIKHIDLLITTLTTNDNKVITVPNGRVITSVLTNYSRLDTRRVDLKFGIGYDADVEKARDLMFALAESNPMILGDPEPFCGVSANTESAVELDFFVWTKTENYWPVKYFMEENVKRAFDEAGIAMPYNQLDVHIRKN